MVTYCISMSNVLVRPHSNIARRSSLAPTTSLVMRHAIYGCHRKPANFISSITLATCNRTQFSFSWEIRWPYSPKWLPSTFTMWKNSRNYRWLWCQSFSYSLQSLRSYLVSPNMCRRKTGKFSILYRMAGGKIVLTLILSNSSISQIFRWSSRLQFRRNVVRRPGVQDIPSASVGQHKGFDASPIDDDQRWYWINRLITKIRHDDIVWNEAAHQLYLKLMKV